MSEVLKVPEGWEIKSLEELCEVVGGGTPKRDDEDNWLNGLIPWATPTDITAIKNSNFINGTKEKITEYGLKNSSSKLLPTNSILLTSRATIGARKINTIPICTNQGFTSLIPKKDNTNFLFYLLSRYERYMNSRAYGTTFPEISRTEVKNVKVLLPSKMIEQQKIAKILSTLDRTIEASQKLIAKEKNIKKGLMHDLLTNGIDENGTIRSPKTHKYKESELGLIPEGWEEKTINETVKLNPESITTKYSDEFEIEYIDISSINDYKVSSRERFKLQDAPSRARRILKDDYIIFSSVRPYLRAISYIDFVEDKNNIVCSTGYAVMYSKEKILYSKYLFYYVQQDIFIDEVMRVAEGSNYPAISDKEFKLLNILYPKDISEQQKIATILTAQDKKIETEEKNLAKLKELKKGLMDDLLSGKVRVKV